MFDNHILFVRTNMQSLDTIFHLFVKPTDIFAILNVTKFTVYECRALSCNESFYQIYTNEIEIMQRIAEKKNLVCNRS